MAAVVFCAITGAAATMATAAQSADSGNPDPILLLIPITPVVRAAGARLFVENGPAGVTNRRRGLLWPPCRRGRGSNGDRIVMTFCDRTLRVSQMWPNFDIAAAHRRPVDASSRGGGSSLRAPWIAHFAAIRRRSAQPEGDQTHRDGAFFLECKL
jgi:hypothetical protein